MSTAAMSPRSGALSISRPMSRCSPQLIAGPIVRYSDVAAQLRTRMHSVSDAAYGARRFVLGLAKKILLANQLGALVSAFRTTKGGSVLYTWLYAVAFLLQIYYDFSGYSDMAIGLGRIFGFRFPENFNYPYIAASITEFWRRCTFRSAAGSATISISRSAQPGRGRGGSFSTF